jgi:hypothetical protein
MTEGFGSESASLTNGPMSPKNLRNLWIRIRNTSGNITIGLMYQT